MPVVADDERAHPFAGAVDLGLDRAERQRELRGDLLVGVFVEEAQHDQLPVAGRQPLEVVFDLGALLQVDDALLGRGARRDGRSEALVDRKVLLPAAHEVDERVAGDGVDPLSEGVAGVVAVEVDVDLDEGLLQQVVDVADAAQPLCEEAVDGVAVAVEEVLERRVVAREDELREAPVFGYDVVVYLHTRRSLRSSMRRSTSASRGSSRS